MAYVGSSHKDICRGQSSAGRVEANRETVKDGIR